MSERIIEVHPYLVKDNLISMKIEVELEDVEQKFLMHGLDKLNLYNIELENGNVLVPRKTSGYINISVTPEWKMNESKNDLLELAKHGENPENVFLFRIRVSCPKTFWSSKQEQFQISEIGHSTRMFKVFVSDILEQVFIEAYITREVTASLASELKATSALSIVSRNDEISIQIDDIETIGGNYLPIKPYALKDLLFKISPGDQMEFPVIYYSEDFEKLFRRNDLFTVNTAFLMIMPALLDHYLKWLIFVAQPDQTDKEQKSLVDKLSKLIGVTKDDLYEIMEGEPTKKTDHYINLSQKLFEGIQFKGGINFKKELERFINQERKLKGEPL